MDDPYPSFVDGETVYSEKNIKLLGVSLDNNLSFGDHISFFCKKTSNQLNAIDKKNTWSLKQRNPYKLFCILELKLLSLCMTFLYIQVNEKNEKNTRTCSKNTL